MIIYTKKDATIIIPCGLGPSVCPDVSHDLQMKTVDSSTVLQQVKPDSGYYGLSSVTVEPYTLDSKTVNSSTAQQVITSDKDGLSSVTVEPYTLDSKTVNSSTAQQVITSSVDGLSSVTVEPYTLDSKIVDPSTSQQTVTSSVDGLSSVTVNAVTSSIDPDIQAGNIKRGVEILGVTGTFDGGSLQSKTVNSSTASQTVEPDNGNYGLSSVTVNPYTLESKAQTITLNGTYNFIPTSADGLSSVDISVNVADIPAVVQSKTVTYTENGEYTVTPDQGYDGLSSVDISVNVPDIPAVLQEKTVNSSTSSQSVTYDSGYDGLSSVTVEPYTLDSKTVNSSTAQQVITSSVDGLSSVIVEPYTLDSKTVNSSTAQQVITSSVDGLSSVTVEPYTLDSKIVDPSTSQQTVTSSVDGLSSVTVNAVTSSIDPDIQAGNIKRGVEILGVTGTFDGGSLQSKEVNSSTNSQSVTPDSGYYGLSGVTVNPYTLESKVQTITVNGTYSFTPTSADGLSSVDISVNVADIPAVVQSKSVTYTENGEYTVTPDQGYEGLSSVDISVNIPPEPVVLQSKTVKSSTESQSVTYDSGFDGLSSVTVEPYVLDSKTVNSSTAQQVITSSVDGLSSVTVNPYTLDSKTVDPSTSQITVNSSADGLSSVTVNAVTSSIDANISSSNIKRGVDILGVTGTFDGGSLGTKTVNSSTSTQTITPEPGDYGLSSVTVNPYTLDAKTVNSSTAQQVITSSVDGLSSVTVEPYTLDSKTVNPSTSQQTVNSSADGLSSVTVNAVTSSIDANIQAGNIKKDVTILGVTGTYESAPTQPNLQDVSVTYLSNGNYTLSASDGYDGLGTVDVSVNIDGATNWIEEVRAGRLTDISGYSIAELARKQYGAAGLFMGSSITTLPRIQDSVDNPNSDVGAASLKQTFYKCNRLQSVDISVGRIGREGMKECFSRSGVRDASIYVGAMGVTDSDMLSSFFYGCEWLRNLYIHLGPDASIAGSNTFSQICYGAGYYWNDNTTITIEGLKEVNTGALESAFSEMHTNNSGGITVNLPDNLSTIRGNETYYAFRYICSNSHLTGKATPSFLGKLDYINGSGNCYHAFSYTDVETATLGFNTCIGNRNFSYAFNSCNNLKSVTFDGSFNITGEGNFEWTFNDCGSLTSITCTSTAGTKPFRYNNENNVANSATKITDVTIDNVNSDVYLLWNPSVNAASVYGILSKATGATVQEGDTRTISFYSSGLTVTDYSDGRIQTAYNAAVADGWTINNLTILPYSNS